VNPEGMYYWRRQFAYLRLGFKRWKCCLAPLAYGFFCHQAMVRRNSWLDALRGRAEFHRSLLRKAHQMHREARPPSRWGGPTLLGIRMKATRPGSLKGNAMHNSAPFRPEFALQSCVKASDHFLVTKGLAGSRRAALMGGKYRRRGPSLIERPRRAPPPHTPPPPPPPRHPPPPPHPAQSGMAKAGVGTARLISR